MLGDVTLVVTPEALCAQAVSVSKEINSMQNEFNTVAGIVSRTKGYWIGEAGDAYRKRYAEYKPELEEIFKRLREYVTDLEKMAGVYEAAEAAAGKIAEELPADIIL